MCVCVCDCECECVCVWVRGGVGSGGVRGGVYYITSSTNSNRDRGECSWGTHSVHRSRICREKKNDMCTLLPAPYVTRQQLFPPKSDSTLLNGTVFQGQQ